MTAFLNAVSEVLSHAWPPEVLLHEVGGVTLTLMSCLLVTTIKGGALMPQELQIGTRSRRPVPAESYGTGGHF